MVIISGVPIFRIFTVYSTINSTSTLRLLLFTLVATDFMLSLSLSVSWVGSVTEFYKFPRFF